MKIYSVILVAAIEFNYSVVEDVRTYNVTLVKQGELGEAQYCLLVILLLFLFFILFLFFSYQCMYIVACIQLVTLVDYALTNCYFCITKTLNFDIGNPTALVHTLAAVATFDSYRCIHS